MAAQAPYHPDFQQPQGQPQAQPQSPPQPGPVAVAASQPAQLVEEMCVAVSSAGGLVGLFLSDRARINATLKQYNDQGFHLIRFDRDVRTNFAYTVLQLLCLLFTLMIWCPSPAAYLFFRRQRAS